MIYKFKDTARVPKGVTASQVMNELDAIGERFGKRSPDVATDAVIKDPDRYPALRAFGPDSPEQAFRDAIRDGITYAVRQVVEDRDGDGQTRALFLVQDSDGDRVWEPIKIIAVTEPYQKQLIAELRRDAAAFTRKLNTVLAEIEQVISG